MQKIDKVVWQETAYVAIWTLIFSTLMQAVFLMIGKWDISVLLGNIYSAAAVIFNFFMIGITVQKAVGKEEKDARQLVKLSGTLRMLFLFVVVVLGVVLNCFNTLAVIVPLLFPRIAILLRPYFKLGTDKADFGAVSTVQDADGVENDETSVNNNETAEISDGEEESADGK